MDNAVQINRIISEVKELDWGEKITLYREIGKILADFDLQQEKSASIESVFGLWKNRVIDERSLREKTWKKN